ncbi:TonB-dependent receptor [Cellvibrio zantedeschiae]|uniref:TonB-dependent receptor n=1 Tax=Cellvibrio zantedeschiae TaxID=1237077 RepID=A0ABQ3AN36_9GAMM|nr:TonB-dependent receptor [Cellvibrio zantedeschiae]GGY61236.1 TonB-dependent receptor [Cellvibrio zantedeschiae]
MKNFNVKPLGVVISGLLMAATTQSVLAQDADKKAIEEADEVIITGFRASIANSIEMKRNADTIVQAISAEDIGGLPDKSIAESLSRLPGITVTRSSGQAGTIQVRGMGEGYVFSTLNGREQVSPNGSRAMEFSQFPSELINSVEVYMSPKASLIEGGIAGTVELKTINPLKMKDDQSIQIGVRGNYNDKADELYEVEPYGKRFSLSFSKKLLDNTLGVSLGYAKLLQPNAASQIENDNYSRPALTVDGKDVYAPESFFVKQKGGEDDRDGYMATVDFEPNEHLAIEADAFYSKFKSQSDERGIRVQGFRNMNVYNTTYFDDIYMTGGTFVGRKNSQTIDFKVENNDTTTDYDIFSGGFNAKWSEDKWNIAADLSHSEASGLFRNSLSRSFLYKKGPVDSAHPDGWYRDDDQQAAFALNGINIPKFSLNRDYTNTATLRMGQYEEYPYINEDKIDAARIDGKYELDTPVIVSIEAGVRVAKRNHKQSRNVFVYGDGAGGRITTDYSLPITDANSDVVNWKGDFSNMPSFLAIDSRSIIEQAYKNNLVLMSRTKYTGPNTPEIANPDAFDANGNPKPRSIVAGARWGEGRSWSMTEQADIQEDVNSFYIQANINTTLWDRDLTGNIGFRRIDTEQSNMAFVNVNGDTSKGAVEICDDVGDCRSDLALTRIGVEYSNNLPSLNLNYHLAENDQLRLALARVLSRAPINRLANFNQGSIDANNPNGPTYNYGSNSSPTLKPFLADQIDISYEHYMPDTNGSFSIAAYHREIKSFIQDASIENFDFAANGFPIPETFPVVEGGLVVDKPVRNGTYTFSTNNAEGGYIRGLEISYTQTFNWLPGLFKGLGVSGSISKVDSKITTVSTLDPNNPDSNLPFSGLVEDSGNITIFYSYENFETRLSTTHQGSFVGEALNIARAPVIYAAETVMDFQASYKFDNGINMIFSVSNLTDEPNRSYSLSEELPRRLNWFGRTFSLGANYKF